MVSLFKIAHFCKPPLTGVASLEADSGLEDCCCNIALVLKNSVRRRVFPQRGFFRFVFFLR
jgi:hypothetical protein